MRTPQEAPPDPSDFFRLNEELAGELERLEAAGHLDRVLELLAGAGARLLVSAARPREGLEELIGVLGPRREDPAPAPADAPPAVSGDDGCGCGPADPERAEAWREVYRRPAGGWDHEGVLAARSRFRVAYPDGTAREVYMPDHVCPACFNDEGNAIRSCARECARCGFAW